MKKLFIAFGFVVAAAAALAGCTMSQSTAPNDRAAVNPTPGSYARTAAATGTSSSHGSENGAAGQIPAFYDGKLITINDVEISDVAADHVGANPSHNSIFVTNDLDDPQDFHPVIDAIQGDGFNPLWEQFLIVFNAGVTPHQFVSDEEVLQAAAGAHPQITLVDTGEVYRCSVVGQK